MIRIAILDDEKADLEKEEQITRQYFYNRQAESEIATYQSVEWFLLGLHRIIQMIRNINNHRFRI